MTNYFYTDANGQKQGPVDDNQLQALATQGIITPESPLETDTGLKGRAGQIPSLKFAAPTAPFNPFTAAKPQTSQRNQSIPTTVESPSYSPTNAEAQPPASSYAAASWIGLIVGGIIGLFVFGPGTGVLAGAGIGVGIAKNF